MLSFGFPKLVFAFFNDITIYKTVKPEKSLFLTHASFSII